MRSEHPPNRFLLVVGRQVAHERLRQVGVDAAGLQLAQDAVPAAPLHSTRGADVGGAGAAVVDEAIGSKTVQGRVDRLGVTAAVDELLTEFV